MICKITTQKTKDKVTRTPLKIGDEPMIRCSGRVGSSCSITYIRHVTLVINQVISNVRRGKD